MFGPGGPQIVGDADMPAVFRVFLSVTVVAHVQHDGSVGEFGGHAFGDVVAGRLAGRPGAAVVFAPGDVGKRCSVAVASLRGNDQSAVGQCDAVAGCRSVEPPFRSFALAGDVDRRSPGQSVVGALGDEKLGSFLYAETGLRPVFPPLMVPLFTLFREPFLPFTHLRVEHSVHPESGHIDVARFFVHENIGIADSVVFFGQSAPLPHIEHHLHGLPGASAVGAAVQADVDVSLQVAGRFISGS